MQSIPCHNALQEILHQHVVHLFQTMPALWSPDSPLLPHCHYFTPTIPGAQLSAQNQ